MLYLVILPVTVHQGSLLHARTHTHAQGYTQKKLVMHDQTDRKERGQTDTWSGLTEDIKKIKGHGPVGFSQEEAKLAEEYSSPVEEEQ